MKHLLLVITIISVMMSVRAAEAALSFDSEGQVWLPKLSAGGTIRSAAFSGYLDIKQDLGYTSETIKQFIVRAENGNWEPDQLSYFSRHFTGDAVTVKRVYFNNGQMSKEGSHHIVSDLNLQYARLVWTGKSYTINESLKVVFLFDAKFATVQGRAHINSVYSIGQSSISENYRSVFLVPTPGILITHGLSSRLKIMADISGFDSGHGGLRFLDADFKAEWRPRNQAGMHIVAGYRSLSYKDHSVKKGSQLETFKLAGPYYGITVAF